MESMDVLPWPELPEEYRWTTELMDSLLAKSDQSPEGMRARADELREEAAASGVKGQREAALVLASHYEAAAESRTTGARP
jgi:hypothetical protein